MPEGPELHLASLFVNQACKGLVFSGRVEKSPVSRNPEVPFESSAYHISAATRGKELRLTLSPLPGVQPPRESLAVTFRFGMSGSFQLAPSDSLPPHAHLRFYTAPPGPQQALCFVDIRRFGRWEVGGQWQPGRGPCVLLEYAQFRDNVLRNLADKAFDRPICEALLDQRFFNGIGNYLRAEILFRLRIPPFERARTVLEALQQRRLNPELTLSQKIRVKLQNPDLLELCHLVPKEVVQLGGKGYGPESGEEDFAAFRAWLRCYGVEGMSCLRDRQGRTIWFQGARLTGRNPRGRSRALRIQARYVLCTPPVVSPALAEPIRSGFWAATLTEATSRVLASSDLPGASETRVASTQAPSEGPSRARSARQALPPRRTAAQPPTETSLQQDPERPLVPKNGKKRRGRAATSGGSPPSRCPGPLQERKGGRAGRRRPRETKADSPSLEPGAPQLLSKGSPSLQPPLSLPCPGVGGPRGFLAAASAEG
ncbi:Endonuclease 8-like 1 [Galemys pyrenaicus]|uniref:Endonuclease 8-like 1 n=1 Tax=Galemys pyrenaicus TaxID=202257 RepID=A0A8J6A8X9_GALPY|nr:Endonuclease 8-like 1 [Galemys pyrenaicus]